MGTKNVQGNNKRSWEQNMFLYVENEAHKVTIAMGAKCYIDIMELNCRGSLVWPYVALYGLVVFHGHLWPNLT